jgi:MSHA biogenesis protein MshP
MKKLNITKTQNGFLLPAAIFLLVILAGLGAYALNITSVQQATGTQDIQSIRAYHIARAGAELSAYYLMQTTPTTQVPTSCNANASTTINLDGFNIIRSCSPVYAPYYEQGGDREIGIYDIKSTASFGTVDTLNYVQREIQIVLSKCRETISNTACP